MGLAALHNYLVARLKLIFISVLLSFNISQSVFAAAKDNEVFKTKHYGLFSSTGTDLIGWETISPAGAGFYTFYSFGFPSFVTAGAAYFSNYNNDGLVLKTGVGIGALLYGSISYQIKLEKNNYFEFGGGYAYFFEGKGLYPIISYVVRK